MSSASKKLGLPIAIVIASVVASFSLYQIQVSKQASIEEQQQFDIAKQRREDAFANELKCQSLLSDLRERWNNVVGISYNALLNTCMVKYTEDGETKESPVESMQDE